MNVNLNLLQEEENLKQASPHTLSCYRVEAGCSILKYLLLRVALCCGESTLTFSSAAPKGNLKYSSYCAQKMLQMTCLLFPLILCASSKLSTVTKGIQL